jgi:hypothetical protein
MAELCRDISNVLWAALESRGTPSGKGDPVKGADRTSSYSLVAGPLRIGGYPLPTAWRLGGDGCGG